MRSTVFALVLASCCALPLAAQSAPTPPTPPRPSPMARLEQAVGVSKVTVQYSRPGVKGRQIFGGLVPWNEVWRTGANEATLFELSHAAEINGQVLPAGKYGLFSIPKPDAWTLIFNRQSDQWGSGAYDAATDALRIEAKAQAIPMAERFEIRMAEVDDNQVVVELRWAEVAVSFTVRFATQELALAQARAFVATAGPADARAVASWASWCLNQPVATDEAETWMAKVVAANDVYRFHALHARLLAKNGKVAAAQQAADHAQRRATGDDAQTPGVAADNAKLQEERKTWK